MANTWKNKRPWLVAAVLAGLLAGCGGDSGGDDGGGTPTPPANATTLTGTASKGLLNNALVTAYGVSSTGTVSATALGSTSTKADGTYSLSIGDYAGAVQIVVSVQTGTTMADEATGAAAVALPADFKLRANTVVAAPTTTTATQSASVTPYTELANSIATSLGGVTSANIVNANGVVFKLIGLDPVATVPIASNATPPAGTTPAQLRYALFNAAVSQLAAATPTTSDTATQACYTAAGSDVGKRVQCATTQLAAAVTISGSGSTATAAANTKLSGLSDALVAAAASTTANKTGTTIAPTDSYVQTLSTQAEAAESGTPTQITVAPITQASTDVATAKAFFSNLRSNAAVLQSGNARTSIVDGMKVFGDSLKTDVASLGVSTSRLITLLARGSELWVNYKNGNSTLTGFTRPGTYDGCTIFQGAFPTAFNGGSINTPYSGTSTTATSKENAAWLGCSTSSGPLRSDGTRRYRQSILVNLADSTNGWAGTNYIAVTRAQYMTGDVTYHENLTPTLSGTVALVVGDNPVGTYSLVGKLPPATDSAGHLLSASYPVNIAFGIGLHSSGAMQLAISSGQLGVIPVGSDTQSLLIDLSVGGTMTAIVPSDQTQAAQVTAAKLSWDAAISEPSGKLSGSFVVDQFRIDSDGELQPGHVKFVGGIAVTPISAGQAGALASWADLTLDATLSQTAASVLAFDGKLTLPNLPVLALKGSVTENADDTGSMQATYTQGALNVAITGTQTATATSVTFADASGVSVTLTDPGTEAKVTVSGRDTAVIREGSNTITYSDGTFETVINPGSGG